MKTKFKNALILTFFALIALTSCQNEVTEVSQPDQEKVIAPNSPLASLMRSTSINDGTVDDIMDSADCMSVNLPVTIIVNSITVTINTHEDLELIREIFEEFSDDEDELEFVFPITIVLSDHTEIVIENAEELENFVSECSGSDDDDVIECVDFVYPISFSIYNTSFQVIETVEVENDEELHDFLDRIEDAEEAILASLNFPVTMKYSSGETVEVNSNEELEAVINEADDMCDDDDYDDCEIEDVDEYLMECYWNIHYYNEDDNFRPFNLFFKEDGALKIINASGTSVITGNWNTSETDEGVVITISELTEFDAELNGEWLVKECDDDRFKLIRQNADGADNTRIVLKQQCEDEPDCSASEIQMYLKECHWFSGSNLYDNGTLGKFVFNEDGTLSVEDLANDALIEGTWEVSLTDYGIKLILELPEPYSNLSGYWKIYQCDDDRIKVIRDDNYIIFERECEDDADECEMELYEMEEFLLDCNILSALYDENGNFVAYYSFSFDPSFGFTVYETPDQVEDGDWSLIETGDGLKLSLENLATFNLIDGNWLYVDCYEEGLIFKQATDSGYRTLKFEKDCENPFECFENKEIEICDEGTSFDGMEVFNLNTVFEECPTDDMEISFHLTEDDAHNNVEALPTEYSNTTNSQTIIARVTLAGTTNYKLFVVVLYVEDCSDDCTEEEVDAYLSEPGCHWVPVEIAGSDDFSAYDFYFNDDLNLVVKDAAGNETVGTWMTTAGTGSGVVVSISQIDSPFEGFNKEWTVVECGPERMVLVNENTELVLERECS